jgi:hypothetical protein
MRRRLLGFLLPLPVLQLVHAHQVVARARCEALRGAPVLCQRAQGAVGAPSDSVAAQSVVLNRCAHPAYSSIS